ncbi:MULTISPECIES: TonB-dependent receptor [Acidithiobacillus]|uniref:TonB-dependent receptor n=3 Tax=Acidithiobacillus TaxID=119977 RepID=A0A179BJA2_ACIFR|nr:MULTISPECIES: TonB-dependent receptor [Acidithiobacillus]MDA8181796.1 TonB-dependent receptor [Acidithiobacillus sp.]MBU2853662.1 TonB-dependent receptor [Acidithiobacillus ferriphilus]MEB8488404.1 TonB-dependent receptor [Acidithiobacillus ferriphilus]MEB8489917.1 TonB-dependent receptor [Acidithiobacillus ferriphilus]MEB8492999.1 TonB-dependent receptor [Acidithiobacillus ferriphilus]
MCNTTNLRPIIVALMASGVMLSSALALADGVTASTVSVGHAAVDVGQVNAAAQGSSYLGSSEAQSLTQKHRFNSGQSVKVLDKHELAAAGPVGGSAQALSYAPGVSVSSYGYTGSTKTSISVNGIKQGWGGFSGGQIDNGSLSVTFDGVPMVNPSTGLWESPQVPQNGILQGIGITYGPGNPVDRWYNNIGGQIDFVPLQPTNKAGASIKMSYGSYDTKNIVFNVRTGSIDGWSTILAGGSGSGNSYRQTPDGFANPSYNYAWFLKTRKTFSNGDFSLGAYLAKGSGYRPVSIPLSPIAGVTMDGTANSPLYSQATSGYYSSLPENVWFKRDGNTTWLVYSKLNLALDSMVGLHNTLWYRNGHRLHFHYNNYGLSNPKNLYEYNNPHTDVYGDKLWFSVALPYNDVNVGGFFLNSRYNSRNAFYNTNPPYYGSASVPNAHYRSDYFDQTDLAAFIQDRISPMKNLHITPGVRFINYQTRYTPAAQSDFAAAYALYPQNNQGTLPTASNSFTKVEPSVDFNWQPMKWLAVFASYAQAYKEPQVGGGGGLYQNTPPLYSLEKSADYNAGIKIHFRDAAYLHNFFLLASFYHLHYTNQYIPFYDANGNYLGDANGDSIYQGVNMALEDDPIYNLHVFANLNFEKATFAHYVTGGVSYDGLPVSNVPSSTFNIGTAYSYYLSGVLLEPRVWYQYTGAQSMFNNNTTAPSLQKMPGYGTVNLGFDSTIPTRGSIPGLKDVKLSVDVLNLANNHYNEFQYITAGGLLGGNSAGQVLALPGAPLTVYGSIAVDF